MDIFTWFTKDVVDPVGSLIEKAAVSGITELEHLAGIASAAIPPAPASSPAVAAFETGLQGGIDTALTGLVGQIPAIGSELAPEAVTLANEGLAWLEQEGANFVNKAAAALKAKLAAYAAKAPPATPAA